MDIRALFGLSILLSFVASALVARLYVVPSLRRRDQTDALLALVLPHCFRFVGLSFLVPGVVSPSLPSAFSTPAAYGDLVAAVLAGICVFMLSRRAALATPLVWLFNTWGATDFLFAFYQGALRIDPTMLGAAFYIPTLVVPPLLVTHGLILWLLLRK